MYLSFQDKRHNQEVSMSCDEASVYGFCGGIQLFEFEFLDGAGNEAVDVTFPKTLKRYVARNNISTRYTYYVHAIKGSLTDKFCKAIGAKKLEQHVNKNTGNTIVFYSIRK